MVGVTEPAAIRLLSLWRDPPDWIVWARPTTEMERRALDEAVDLVITIDVGEDPDARIDYGVADVAVAVRWADDPRQLDNIASYIIRRDIDDIRSTPWVAWLKDIRRDLRRRHAKHGKTYTRGRIHVLDARKVTHGSRS